jgi:allantoate deiminase
MSAATNTYPDLCTEIMAHVAVLARLSETPEGLTRRYLTPQHRQAADLVLAWMREAGMDARLDAVGNMVGYYEGQDSAAPALMMGSHIDTVRDAGRFDGMLGVIMAIACVRHLHRAQKRLPCPIVVVGFGDEEGLRFRSTLIGSRAVAGTLDPAVLNTVDDNGICLAQALREFALDPDRIADAAWSRDKVGAYVEVHIEQGPVLEQKGVPVGVVTSIAGAVRYDVRMTGFAGHAGTVPMAMRQDAVAGAAQAVLEIERICTDGPTDLVGTVGHIEAQPGSVNVIPGLARFTIDLRAGTDEILARAEAEVVNRLHMIATARRLSLDLNKTHAGPSCSCSDDLQAALGKAIASEGYPVVSLSSGAGHDAMAIADLVPVGMLFVRCRSGISHNPEEDVDPEDIEVAARTMLRFLHNFVSAPTPS